MHKAFPLLSDRASSKRVRTEDINFFMRPRQTFPRFHVIHCEKTNKQARTVSPFVVARSLTETLGAGYKVTKMASGDLLLEIHEQNQFDKLNTLTTFGDTPISITPHRSMNSSRGVVSDVDLLELTEAELLEGWKSQNVTNVQRIKIRRDQKEIPTKHLVLTFASSDLPETIQTGYTKTSVRPYIPNPRRCFQCQKYGHGSKTCRGRQTCAQCGVLGHVSENCKQPPHCVNCEGNHAAYSRSCTYWKKEKEIITLKVKENITFKEARRRVAPFYGATYADAARQGAPPHQPSPLPRPAHSEPVVVAPAPKAAVAQATPPTPKQRLETPESSNLKASPPQVRPEIRTSSPHVRASSASEEAMDTSAPLVPKERRGSLERAKKTKKPITGPGDGPVK
ncbi:uncharacterized protein LOC119171694 isoform X1 [Rhipicephalus microplus]|uniref:uncharacterized protein LOC119171694 isoform X1 n=1 Tax=Rhipicephalus microplus TaxID=6941 RepID=UPI003F6C04B8